MNRLAGPGLDRYHRNAPRHPGHVEEQARKYIIALFIKIRANVVATIDSGGGDIRKFAYDLINGASFQRLVAVGGRRMASLLKIQLTKLTGEKLVPHVSLAGIVDEYAATVTGMTQSVVDELNSRLTALMVNWFALAGAAQEERRKLVMESILKRIDGASGTAVARFGVIFGYSFFLMNQAIQRALGIARYIWLTRRDKRVRAVKGTEWYGHHKELEGVICRWDTPPLTADKATNGQPCHAGQDINCRCIGAPYIESKSRSRAPLRRVRLEK